jgi:hypothetical protein
MVVSEYLKNILRIYILINRDMLFFQEDSLVKFRKIDIPFGSSVSLLHRRGLYVYPQINKEWQ